MDFEWDPSEKHLTLVNIQVHNNNVRNLILFRFASFQQFDSIYFCRHFTVNIIHNY